MRGQSLVRSVLGHSKSGFSTSPASRVPTAFRFPAMSPTMTEGGIASWKVKEGDSFAPGDVLFEIETDKATMDVETTEEGIMGKIIAPEGTKNLQVGTLIAIVAEEGDDLSSISASDFESAPPDTTAPTSSSSSSAAPTPAPTPKEPESTSTSSAPPSHDHKTLSHPQPLSPSVARLLQSSSLSAKEITALKGSGMRGALTKGDVLKAIGKTQTVWGSKEAKAMEEEGKKGVAARFKLPPSAGSPAAAASKPPPPQDPVSVRRAVVAGFAKGASSAPAKMVSADLSFDALLAEYVVPAPAPQPKAVEPAATKGSAPKKAKVVVEKGDFEGIW